MGMSEGNIRNSVINKIIAFLKKNDKAMEILSDIQDIYNESLMIEMVGFERDMIIETLVNDDMFILLEELNRWGDKNVFKCAFKGRPLKSRYILFSAKLTSGSTIVLIDFCVYIIHAI